jgi:pimeloyl-ACP methyl ester carboxylesterase
LSSRRVLAFDARGHGASGWASDEDYSVDAHFADLVTALGELGIERCVLAGFSMGGGTAVMMAACAPELVAALAVVDAYPYAEQSSGSARIARWVSGQTDATTFDPAIARKFQDLLAAGVSTRADLGPLWRAVECPALVVRGERSPVLPADTAEQMLEDLPHARLVMVEGVAHAIPLVRPAELAAMLGTFHQHDAREIQNPQSKIQNA